VWINNCSEGGLEEQNELEKFTQEIKEYLTKKETFKRAIAPTYVIVIIMYHVSY